MECDIAILGGGCAGLSLATLLADAGPRGPRVAIVEPRRAYRNDRTWSGWHDRHRFGACVRARWTRWSLSSGQRRVVRANPATPYETIPADRFYDAALQAISRAPRVCLYTATRAGAVGEATDRAWVETDAGRLTARLVVDTRPPEMQARHGLLQSFAGMEIETDRPCFDPSTVGLMEFGPASDDGITFLYTLPFSETRALLELTRMAPDRGLAEDGGALLAMLGNTFGAFHVVREESGCLPMHPALPARPVRRVLRLGTPAGALRASTGYGFGTIQAQALALSGLLLADMDAAIGWRAAPPPGWMRFMDRLFLRVLRAHPEVGPKLLTTLFQRCPSTPLIRFLGGTAGLLDGGLVALSMPKLPFLRELALPA